MAIDSITSAIGGAPLGDELPVGAADDIVVEIELPGEPQDVLDPEPEALFDANLALEIDASKLGVLATDLVNDYEQDLLSRADWEQTYTRGLKLLGVTKEVMSMPWQNACGVFHPMITEAVVRFQAETITETFPAAGPVRTKIIGRETKRKKDAARRVMEDMNYQLTEQMPEYRSEHERMLWSLPLAGSAFKKVYYDPTLGRQISMFVGAEDIVLPYGTSELSLCARITHRMRKTPNEITRLQAKGFYVDTPLEMGAPEVPDDITEAKDRAAGYEQVNDDRLLLLEMHVELDLAEYDYEDAHSEPSIAVPYVVTIDKTSNTVLSVRRNWREEDSLHLRRQHFVHYQYVPGFGAYGFGLLHLIGNSAEAVTSILRQLVDAGTLSNLPGGFKATGMRVKGDSDPVKPGEWKDVDIPSGTMKDNIMPLPYKEPSPTLFQLMGTIAEDARRFASTADMKISDMSAQAPVGTTLAIIERSLKILSAVQARVHFSMKQELKLLAGIIRDYADPDYTYDAEGDERERSRQEDFSFVDIIPVSDPNASTMAQRVIQHQAVLQLAQGAPQLYDMPLLHRQMLEALGIKDADKLVKLPEDAKPQDPVSENMAIINMKPVKAFMYQDHESHIKVHMAAMQDPQLMKLMGQNPQAQAMMAAAQAHIAEHIAYAYRSEMEKLMGVALPAPDEDLAPEAEVQLSRLTAQAAGKLLGRNQALAQAEKNAQMQADPVIQMQQEELAIKKAEVELKKQKQAIDAAAEADRLESKQALDAANLELKATEVGAKVALEKTKLEMEQEKLGLTVGVDVAKTQAQLAAKAESEGLRMGLDVAKTLEQQKQQAGQPPAKTE